MMNISEDNLEFQKYQGKRKVEGKKHNDERKDEIYIKWLNTFSKAMYNFICQLCSYFKL